MATVLEKLMVTPTAEFPNPFPFFQGKARPSDTVLARCFWVQSETSFKIHNFIHHQYTDLEISEYQGYYLSIISPYIDLEISAFNDIQ